MMDPHVFIVMPFGEKDKINFDQIYCEFIEAGLTAAGFRVFRADEETAAGNIRSDMFQELLIADLVVADLSIDNPNVWYELGVRHALRARGVIQIAADSRLQMPFDVYTDRTLRYHVKDGGPNPEYLEQDQAALVELARQTLARWHGYKVSPVYHLLPNLPEPAWKRLLVAGPNEFSDQLRQWKAHIRVARRRNRPGDIVLLAQEMPTRVLRMETHRTASKALMKLGQYQLALQQCEQALYFEPNDLATQQQNGVLLGRLGKHERARALIHDLLAAYPNDAETLALSGRIEKEEWSSRWRDEAQTTLRQKSAGESIALLNTSIELYTAAFTRDPSHYYSGINAITLHYLRTHLCGETTVGVPDQRLAGGVRWACLSAISCNSNNYWARVSLADLELLCADTASVIQGYRDAVAHADRDWFALDSTRQQLCLLRDLAFRPAQTQAALAVVEEEITRCTPPLRPRTVFLFSGHMIDRPDRIKPPRFPKEKELIAAQSIANKLDELQAGQSDLAICGGACGADILFAEACKVRGLRLQLHIQYNEPNFLQASVSFAGQDWVDRYFQLTRQATVLVQPDELGLPPKGSDVYTRNNLWQLYTALSYGAQCVRFISLWDGQDGDSPGGTHHMVNTVRQYAGRAFILDTRKLW